MNEAAKIGKGGGGKSFALAKVDESQQIAVGLWTAEIPDSDREIADYDFQSGQVQEWSDGIYEQTKAAGQEPSRGNLRYQHTTSPVGKVISVVKDDSAKTIGGETYVHAPDVWEMTQKGILTGFSFGGHYLWRKCNECGAEMPLQCGENWCPSCKKDVIVRYGAKIAELSIVDRPAVPMANILHIKADGSQTMVKVEFMDKEKKTKRVAGEDLTADCFIIVGDADDPSTWKLPWKFSTEAKTKSHLRNALARFSQLKGVSDEEKKKAKAKLIRLCREHDIDVSEEDEKNDKAAFPRTCVKAIVLAIEERVTEKVAADGLTVTKGMWEVGAFAEALQQMAWLRYAALQEREMEGDESDIPDLLSDNIESLADTFMAMAEEEIEELKAAAKKAGKVTTMKKEVELPENIGDLMTGHIADTAAHHEHLAEQHKAMASEHGEQEKMHKAAHEHFAKAAEEGGEHSEHHEMHAKMHKAMAEHHAVKAAHHETMHKAHKDHAEKCMKMAEACSDHEKAEKAIKDARAALPKPAAPVAKTVQPVFSSLPENATDVEKAAFARAQKAWFESEEYTNQVTAALREQTKASLNYDVSNKAQIVAGAHTTATVHAVTRTGDVSKAASQTDKEVEAALGY